MRVDHYKTAKPTKGRPEFYVITYFKHPWHEKPQQIRVHSPPYRGGSDKRTESSIVDRAFAIAAKLERDNGVAYTVRVFS